MDSGQGTNIDILKKVDALMADQFYQNLNVYIRLNGAEQVFKTLIPQAITRPGKNGVAYSEVMRVAARMRSFDSWPSAWSESARKFEEIAAEAEKSGRNVTAMEAYLHASYLFHYSQIYVRPGRKEKKEGALRSYYCYSKAAKFFDPPAERIEVPYEDITMPGYLRLPKQADKVPCVVMLDGADGSKEEAHNYAESFLKVGIAPFYFDGPGQAEIIDKIKMPVEYERAASAAVDAVVRHPKIDPDRIAVYGVSMGGYLAARAAAFDKRIKAGISLGGFYDFRDFPRWPVMVKEAVQSLFWLESLSETCELVETRLTLKGIMDKVSCPFLVAHGAQDHLLTMEEINEMVADAPGRAELLLYENGDHTLGNVAAESRPRMADWLKEKLT